MFQSNELVAFNVQASNKVKWLNKVIMERSKNLRPENNGLAKTLWESTTVVPHFEPIFQDNISDLESESEFYCFTYLGTHSFQTSQNISQYLPTYLDRNVSV